MTTNTLLGIDHRASFYWETVESEDDPWRQLESDKGTLTKTRIDTILTDWLDQKAKDYGIDSLNEKNETLLSLALQRQNVLWVSCLLAKGAEPKGLPLAVKSKDFASAKLLLEHGASIFEKDREGFSCFHYLTPTDGMAQFFRDLIAANIKIDPGMKEKLTPAFFAAMLPLLASVNFSDFEGYAPYISLTPTIVTAIAMLLTAPTTELWHSIKQGDYFYPILFILPALASLAVTQSRLASSIMLSLTALSSVQRLFSNDLPEFYKSIQKNRALQGLLFIGFGALRTAMCAIPALKMLTKSVSHKPVSLDAIPQQNSSCTATFFLKSQHTITHLECKPLAINMTVGFYPNPLFSFAKIKMVMNSPLAFSVSPTHGWVADESRSLAELCSGDVPRVVEYITPSLAERAVNYVKSVKNDCISLGRRCIYQLIGRNCVDFTQEIYQQLGNRHHFFDKLDRAASGPAGLYGWFRSRLFRI